MPKNTNKKVFVFFGLPGSGKSTVASKFAGILDGKHIEADSLLSETFKTAVKSRIVTKEMRYEHSLDVIEKVKNTDDCNLITVSKGCAHYEDRDIWKEHFENIVFIQIECGFDVLMRRVKERDSWINQDDLREIQKAFKPARSGELRFVNESNENALLKNLVLFERKLMKGAFNN